MVEEIVPKISMINFSFLIISFLDKLREGFDSGVTKPVAWRKQQLRNLLNGINEMKI